MKFIVFDAFGTLMTIGRRRGPYRQLMQWLYRHGREELPSDAAQIMSLNLSFHELARQFRANVPSKKLASWEADLVDELKSIALFEDVPEAISCVRAAGLGVGLCSNLAAPYGMVVRTLLPDFDFYTMSYEVGVVKPDPRIYSVVLQAAQCSAADVLFIGDTVIADVEGPTLHGMQARLLDRRHLTLPSLVRSSLSVES